jgi:hypothetical protein
VAILTHPKQDQVEDRHSCVVGTQVPPQLLRGGSGCSFRFILPTDSVHLRMGDGQRLQKAFPSLSKVALRIGWQHAALVTPEEMHMRPPVSSCLGFRNDCMAKGPQYTTTAKCNAKPHHSVGGSVDFVDKI